jgi:hypothetical protein
MGTLQNAPQDGHVPNSLHAAATDAGIRLKEISASWNWKKKSQKARIQEK